MAKALLPSNATNAETLAAFPYWYQLCGLAVTSELALPAPPVDDVDSISALSRLTIRLKASPVEAWLSSRGCLISEEHCGCEIHRGSVVTRLWEGDDGYWLWKESVATFYIPRNAERVDVYPEFGAEEWAIADTICSTVIAFVVQGQG